MVDAHCHIGLYARPAEIATRCEDHAVTTVAVTNLPSEYRKLLPHTRHWSSIELALGLHPLARATNREREAFTSLVDDAPFVGEVGLDFSQSDEHLRVPQVETFEIVLASIKGRRHFVSVHSRRADAFVLDMLERYAIRPVVLHWFSGSQRSIRRALDSGHLFSINPAMAGSQSGQRIIEALPRDRVLTETDGPFVKVSNRPAEPSDVRGVLLCLSGLWGLAPEDVEAVTHENFQRAFTASA